MMSVHVYDDDDDDDDDDGGGGDVYLCTCVHGYGYSVCMHKLSNFDQADLCSAILIKQTCVQQ